MKQKLFKKVSKAGGITIPQQLRHELNIPKGSAVEVESTDDALIIRKHIPTCLICGTAEEVLVVKEVELCKNCLKQFEEENNNGNKDN